MSSDDYVNWPKQKLRDYQALLHKNLAEARPNSFEWRFNTNQLDVVNRALAAAK